MAAVTKIDSNVSGLRYAEELTIGVLPGSPVWQPLEPNSYTDFGGEIVTVARNPINPSRQRKKGRTVDLNASGGFNTDLTQSNLQDILQGFFFADLRRKGEEHPTSATVQAGDDTYEMASTAGFFVGSLIFVTGFANAANNGLKRVTAVTANVSVAVAETLVNESAPAAAQAVVIGHQFAAGDLDVTTTGDYATYTSTTKDLTQLGLVPGEFFYVGGDSATLKFTNSANNGFKRAKSIATNALVVDKSALAMITEASTTETIQIFVGRVLKNETGSLIKRRTYQLERTLGAPDDAAPSQIQSEYLVGQVPSEITLNLVTADKMNADLAFVGTDFEQRSGVTGVKSGTRPALVEMDMFTTSSDVTRIKLHKLVAGTEAPSALFAFLQEMNLTVNNNVSPNKAIGRLGAFEVTAGTFEVSGQMTAYFSDVAAITAIRDNDDVSLDLQIVRSNAGISVDFPLLTLGDGRANVEQDQPITIPLSADAATGAKVDPNMDHTLLMVFYDFLPTLADTLA